MSSLFLHVLFLLLMGSKICTALQADCSCNNYVNPNGFGKCKKLFPQLNNQFFCFVNEPTTCSDVYSINSEPIHRNVSAQACREAQASDLDTTGFLTNADFDKAKEERFNTPILASALSFDPDLFEGDIVDDDFGDTINVAERKWPKSNDGKVYIPISFPATASTKEKAAIARTILEFENKTCVRLRQYNETTDFSYVHINTRGFGCQSPVGRKGGRQTIRARDCFSEEGGWGHLCHEIMHSLGFYHEHTRSDRDDHVEVLWEEIERVKGEDNLFRIEKNFIKCRNCTTYGVYDLASIMHYPSLLGFQNRTVLRPKSELYSPDEINKMGQRDGLSPLDVEDIQKYFECDLSFSQHEEQCDIKLSKKEHELCQYVDCTNHRARELCGEVCNAYKHVQNQYCGELAMVNQSPTSTWEGFTVDTCRQHCDQMAECASFSYTNANWRRTPCCVHYTSEECVLTSHPNWDHYIKPQDVNCPAGNDGYGGSCKCSDSTVWDQGKWQHPVCYDGVCIMSQEYSACKGKANRHLLGDGTWCRDEKRSAICPTNKETLSSTTEPLGRSTTAFDSITHEVTTAPSQSSEETLSLTTEPLVRSTTALDSITHEVTTAPSQSSKVSVVFKVVEDSRIPSQWKQASLEDVKRYQNQARAVATLQWGGYCLTDGIFHGSGRNYQLTPHDPVPECGHYLLIKEYELVKRNMICGKGTRFITTSSMPGCDGWGRMSLEDCKKKCSENEIPRGCMSNQNTSKICKYVIWDANRQHPPGWCQLADDECSVVDGGRMEMWRVLY